MNIFVTHPDPKIAAQWHCDKHVVKQITETLQMLACAAIRHNVPTELLPLTKKGTPVKGGYHKHPCSIWAGNTRENFFWLVQLGVSLCEEYTLRYGKSHFCQKGIEQMLKLAYYIPRGAWHQFPVAIARDKICRQKVENFDSLPVPIQYRLYIKNDKPFAEWKINRPQWMDLSNEEIIQRG